MAEKGWREITLGGMVLEPGSSVAYKTGTWRSFRPIIDLGKCRGCLVCWAYCPDGCIIVEEGRMRGTNFDYCKGCGICATECPQQAITIVEEIKTREVI